MADSTVTGFGRLLADLPADSGSVAVSERTGLGIATVMTRKGQAEALGQTLGFAVTEGPVRSVSDDLTLLGIGPGAWLMLAEEAAPGWASLVAADLAGTASVFDQSSGYAILRISGRQATALMQKAAFIDLATDVFSAGSVAVTVIEHVGAILWRLDDTTFEIAVFRSFAASFWHWLVTAAAAMGVALYVPR